MDSENLSQYDNTAFLNPIDAAEHRRGRRGKRAGIARLAALAMDGLCRDPAAPRSAGNPVTVFVTGQVFGSPFFLNTFALATQRKSISPCGGETPRQK